MNQRELPLKFEQIRTFGKVFSDTRKLIRENFVIFFKTMLFLVGPVALITCSLHTFYEVRIIGPGADFDWTRMGSYIAGKTIFTQLKWIINGLVTAMVVSHFMKVYKEKGPGRFDVNDVTKSLVKDIVGSLGTAFLIFIIVTGASLIIGGLLYVITEMSLGTGVFMIGLAYIGYFLVRFPVWYFLYSVFVARHSESPKLNPMAALQSAGRMLSGNWWQTWLIFFCMWALVSVLGSLISMPAEILSMIAGLSAYDPAKNADVDWVLVHAILKSVGEFARTLIYSVFCAAITLHFYSLKEKKDGKGTMELLDQIGKTKDTDDIELTY